MSATVTLFSGQIVEVVEGSAQVAPYRPTTVHFDGAGSLELAQEALERVGAEAELSIEHGIIAARPYLVADGVPVNTVHIYAALSTRRARLLRDAG